MFANTDGPELFDLPDAPRPAEDTPAPVRFLYDYDNLLLSHADRRRVVGEPGDVDSAAQGYHADSNLQPSTVLVDGMVAATWRVSHDRDTTTLDVRALRPLAAHQFAEIEAEGAAPLGFLHPGRRPDVRVSR